MSKPRSLYIIFAIASSILSSVATLFKVQGVRHVHPVLAASIGVLFAGSVTLLYLALSKQLPSLMNIRKIARPLLKLAFCRSVFSNLIFTYGLTMSSGVEAVFLTKMEPYLVIFWVWVLDGKRPSANHLLLLFVHITGAIMLAIGDKGFSGDVSWYGDLVIVSGVVTAALSYRFAPQVTKVLTPTQTASLGELIGGIVTVPIALLLFPLVLGPEQVNGWCYIGVHAVLFYIFAISLLYASLDGIEGWLSSALRATGPLIAAPIALIFFGETLTFVQGVGALVVLTTSALISKKEKPRS